MIEPQPRCTFCHEPLGDEPGVPIARALVHRDCVEPLREALNEISGEGNWDFLFDDLLGDENE